MSDRVRRQGERARKSLVGYRPDHARRLADLSRRLAAAGVRTPVATYDEPAHELVFPWIIGVTGRELVSDHLAAAEAPGDQGLPANLLATLLKPLVRLHGVDPASLDLEPFDPWRMIRPRLAAGSGLGVDAPFLARARAVDEILRALIAGGTEGSAAANDVPVHGDYHVGQLQFPSARSEPWLLDVDDIALGPPASDLGNFVAHLVTRNSLVSDVLSGFERLVPSVAGAYDTLGGTSGETRRIDAFGAVALLRRALKLAEGGAARDRVEAILSAVEVLAGRIER